MVCVAQTARRPNKHVAAPGPHLRVVAIGAAGRAEVAAPQGDLGAQPKLLELSFLQLAVLPARVAERCVARVRQPPGNNRWQPPCMPSGSSSQPASRQATEHVCPATHHSTHVRLLSGHCGAGLGSLLPHSPPSSPHSSLSKAWQRPHTESAVALGSGVSGAAFNRRYIS